MPIADEREDGTLAGCRRYADSSVYARDAGQGEVRSADGTFVVPAGADLGDVLIGDLVAAGVTEVRVRSRADLRVGARHLRHVLRPLAGHRQARGRRRGGRHHRGAVDR